MPFALEACKLVMIVAVCHSAGLIGSLFVRDSISWYRSLNRPFFAPPDWIFLPVWLILYTCMGIAAYLVWRKGVKKLEVRSALEVFLLQLIFNTAWTVVFFGLHSVAAGLLVIAVLWLAIFLTVDEFRKISPLAAFLLLPYLIWVGFAFLLNASILLLEAQKRPFF